MNMKSSKNSITGDSLISKPSNKAFEEGYDRIFASKSEQKRIEVQKEKKKEK